MSPASAAIWLHIHRSLEQLQRDIVVSKLAQVGKRGPR